MRVLIAKPGLDGHDLGARLVAANLRDAGIEVIYTGRHLIPGQIVAAAVQEDVAAIGLSILSGAHFPLVEQLMEEMREKKVADNIKVIVGGTIPRKDIPKLKAMGATEVFGVGTPVEAIVNYFTGISQSQV